MRAVIFCVVLALGGAAMADELGDANAALTAKAYPRALQLYSKLASAGNAEAQLRLGEMYWYGEGVALDRSRGDALFVQAAAGGNKEAAAATSLSARRAQHGAQIAYWTSGYDGADLSAGKYACVAPTLPAVSTTNADIQATNQAMTAWRTCYDGFTENLAAALPAGTRIPPEVAVLMSEDETQQARKHLDKVYREVMVKAQAGAATTLAQHDKWEAATMAAVAELNRTAEQRAKQIKLDLELQARVRSNSQALDRSVPNNRQR